MMTAIEMFKSLRINASSLSEYIGLSQKTISNKMVLWYDLTEKQLEKMREYLDLKIRDMIKIMKKIDKVLDDN